MYSQLYTKDQYTMDTDYIVSAVIREYDISKANINILLYFNFITKEKYEELLSLEKLDRQVQVGYMLRDNQELNQKFTKAFAEVRRLFFEANNIQDDEVLSIKKDAIFLLRPATITQFSNIVFTEKNVYTSFYRIDKNLHAYFLYDQIHHITKLDIKGIGDEVLPAHSKGFMLFLTDLFSTAVINPNSAINFIQNYYALYINLALPIQHYRRFSPDSDYGLLSNGQYSEYRAHVLNEIDKDYVDISYNRNLIRNLYKIFSDVYFKSNSKPKF